MSNEIKDTKQMVKGDRIKTVSGEWFTVETTYDNSIYVLENNNSVHISKVVMHRTTGARVQKAEEISNNKQARVDEYDDEANYKENYLNNSRFNYARNYYFENR